MNRIVLLAAVALVVVYQVLGAPNHHGSLKEVKRNLRGYQSADDEEPVKYCNEALEQQREVICQHNHGTDSPHDRDEFVGRREASKFLGRGVQGLVEECCHEGCHSEEIHERCPEI